MNANQQQRVLGMTQQGARPLPAAQSGGNMTVPALYTDFLPMELMDAPRDFFVYGVDFQTIAAVGGSATQTFTVQNDSDFLIVAVAATVVDPTDEGVARSRDALTIEMFDGGSGRALQNRAQAFSNLVGTAQLPAYWPFPKLVDRASDFQTTIVNNDPADAARVRLSYIGFKVFPGYPRQ